MKSFIPDKVYDVLKWLAIIAFPALAVFIKALFPVWNIPYGDEISTTIVIVNALLGALIGISSIQYSNNKE